MIDSDKLYAGMEIDDDLSSATVTETLRASIHPRSLNGRYANRDFRALRILQGGAQCCPAAFDNLDIPAMSSECERTFSSAKKLLAPERNALADDIIKAIECLKAWEGLRA